MDFSISYGEGVGLACAFIWAVHNLLLRTQVHKAPVALLNAIRCGAASVFFWILLPFGPPLESFGQVTALEWVLLAGSVVTAIGIGDTLQMVSIREIGVSRNMALSGLHPLSTLFFEWLLLGSPFGWTFVVGCCLAVLGIVCLADRTHYGTGASDSVPGNLKLGMVMGLTAVLFWGVGTVMTKPAIAHLTPVQANSVRMPLVALALYMPRFLGGRGPELRRLNRRTLAIFAGLGVLSMGLGSMLFLTALDLIGPAKTSTLSSVSPVLGLVMAVIFLKEKVNFRVVMGVGLCMLGVWLVL